jgi:transposase InsO family protein
MAVGLRRYPATRSGAPARTPGREVHRAPSDAHRGAARDQQGQGSENYAPRTRSRHPARPAEPRLPGTRTEPGLGRGHHLLPPFRRLGLRRLRIDVYSRRVVGWQLSKSLHTDLALDALEMGLWSRAHAGQETTGVIAHSDKGGQYLAVRYTQRLAETGAAASVGPPGTATTMPWPKGSTRCSKLNGCATRGRGRASTTSRSPSPRTSTVQSPTPARRDRTRPTRRVRGRV